LPERQTSPFEFSSEHTLNEPQVKETQNTGMRCDTQRPFVSTVLSPVLEQHRETFSSALPANEAGESKDLETQMPLTVEDPPQEETLLQNAHLQPVHPKLQLDAQL